MSGPFRYAAPLMLAILAAACGEARKVSPAQGQSGDLGCTRCHGGTDNATGAPPRDLAGRTATSERSVGAHSAHVGRGIDCRECHPKPVAVSSPGHGNGIVDVVLGALAGAGASSPSYRASDGTCSGVYCHGAALSGGSNTSPRWTTVDGSQAACGACHGLPPAAHPTLASGSLLATCSACHPETVAADGSIAAGGAHVNGRRDGFSGHPAGWATPGSPDFHGPVAVGGAGACLVCHAGSPPARVTNVACSDCHDGGTTGCSTCHGSAANAAPPRDAHGNTDVSVVGVGAHQSHVTAAHGIAPPLDCTACHRVPTEMFSPGHMDGTADVTGYTGADPDLLAVARDPGWSAGGRTCATSYCHGATLSGGSFTAPVWTTADGSQVACGGCHGLPPPAGHPALAPGSTAATCSVCHPPIADGKHVNGRRDGFPGHPAGWISEGSPDFHGPVAAGGAQACLECHAASPPPHVTTVVCSACHDQGPGGCNTCHGSAANAAPPKDAHGNTDVSAVGVGAHQSHVTAAHGIAALFECTACHQVPAELFSPGHMDGATAVTGYTGSDPALAAVVADPGWDAAARTCSTSYCHGATLVGGSHPAPVWTAVDGTQAACGSCHGLPPFAFPGPNHPQYVFAAPCLGCHPATATVNAAGADVVVPGGQHLNGRVEYTFGGHPPGWVGAGGGLHAQEWCMGCGSPAPGYITMSTYYDYCTQCHGVPGDFHPSGGSSRVSCGACHPAFFNADSTTSCSFCH